MKSNVKLGDLVEDRLTKLQGIAIAEYRYLNGCVRFEVQPQKLKDGAPAASSNYDVEQLRVVKEAAYSQAPRQTGGPAVAKPVAFKAPKR